MREHHPELNSNPRVQLSFPGEGCDHKVDGVGINAAEKHLTRHYKNDHPELVEKRAQTMIAEEKASRKTRKANRTPLSAVL